MNQIVSQNGLLAVGIPIVVAFLGASVAAVTDVVEYRVRNRLTFPLIATGVAYHAIIGGWAGLTDSLAGVLFGLGVLIVPWLLGLMGAGDAKLLAGVGAWLGLVGATVAFLVTTATTCAYAIILIICRGKLRESLVTIKIVFYRFVALGTFFGKNDLVEEFSTASDHRLRVIPFGAMVPIGVVGVLLWLSWIRGAF